MAPRSSKKLRNSKPRAVGLRTILLVAGPTALGLVLAIVIMRWTVPAVVTVDIVTERVSFVVGTSPMRDVPILDPLDATSLTLDEFGTIAFNVDNLLVADQSRYDVSRDLFPPGAWKRLPKPRDRVMFDGRNASNRARVTLDATGRDHPGSLHIDPIDVESGASCTIEASSGKSFEILVTVTAPCATNIVFDGDATLIANGIRSQQVSAPPSGGAPDQTYKIHFPVNARFMEVSSGSEALTLIARLKPEQASRVLTSNVPVATLDLTRQNSFGERVSALLGGGHVRFPDAPYLADVLLSDGDALRLEGLKEFRMQSLVFAPGGRGLRLRGDGIADRVYSRAGPRSVTHRVTMFDALQHSPALSALLGIALWVFPTTLGARRLLRDLKAR